MGFEGPFTYRGRSRSVRLEEVETTMAARQTEKMRPVLRTQEPRRAPLGDMSVSEGGRDLHLRRSWVELKERGTRSLMQPFKPV